MGKGETTVVFCISEPEANAAAAADPATCAAVRRQDARRSFLGLQVELSSLSGDRLRSLAEQAWRQQAPKRLAAEHDRDESASRQEGCHASSVPPLCPEREGRGLVFLR